jgi:hypothetical protein
MGDRQRARLRSAYVEPTARITDARLNRQIPAAHGEQDPAMCGRSRQAPRGRPAPFPPALHEVPSSWLGPSSRSTSESCHTRCQVAVAQIARRVPAGDLGKQGVEAALAWLARHGDGPSTLANSPKAPALVADAVTAGAARQSLGGVIAALDRRFAWVMKAVTSYRLAIEREDINSPCIATMPGRRCSQLTARPRAQ